MDTFPKSLLTVWLLAVVLFLQSCNDNVAQFEKKKVQFTLSPASNDNGRVGDIDLPENTRLRISIVSNNGTSVFSNQEIPVLKIGTDYITDPVELMPGAYAITDFMLVNGSAVLYATPKNEAPLSTYVKHALPYNFSIDENNVTNVGMQVIDVQGHDSGAFGYASLNIEVVDTDQADSILSLTVFNTKGEKTKATAELRQNKKLIKTFALDPAVNNIAFEGNLDSLYTLTVYTQDGAKTNTFNFKNLKKELGNKPLQVTLEPALVLTVESYYEEGLDYEDYFDFVMDGAGEVDINWGDGYTSTVNMPFEVSHEYFVGNYTIVITGDVNQVTNFYGFSYSTIISTITGLTNLTSLKTYNPSWGAVPIKVDLSNCTQLETIYISKYGAPYEPMNMATEFKLPTEHLIKEFILDIPSFDITREYLSAEELEALVTNIHNNTAHRNISDGKFFVNPVGTWSTETQEKLDELQNEYNWQVRFNDDIYNYYEEGRAKSNAIEVSRENWLRTKFPNKRKTAQSTAAMAVVR